MPSRSTRGGAADRLKEQREGLRCTLFQVMVMSARSARSCTSSNPGPALPVRRPARLPDRLRLVRAHVVLVEHGVAIGIKQRTSKPCEACWIGC